MILLTHVSCGEMTCVTEECDRVIGVRLANRQTSEGRQSQILRHRFGLLKMTTSFVVWLNSRAFQQCHSHMVCPVVVASEVSA